jgi:hypothetical protein
MASEKLADMEKEINPLEKEVKKLNERINVLRTELRNKVNPFNFFFFSAGSTFAIIRPRDLLVP